MITEGPAMFIGTPKGKNHFFKLYAHAEETPGGDWESFHFTSFDNPFLSDAESDRLQRDMGSDKQRQELEAEFTANEGVVFRREWFKMSDAEPEDGGYAIAVDLAGFKPAKGSSGRDVKRLDETAIAIVKVHRGGWWVKEIRHGQWDTRETANRIIRAAKEHQCGVVGIEKGALSNAVQPYLQDYMTQYQRWVHIVPLTHGNQRKADRIAWALQGRAEKGRLVLNPGPWAERLIGQAMDFPDPRSKDDLLDALAYIDQMAGRVSYMQYDPRQANQHEVLDKIAGW
jgi:phage terminase large subunit-like protein